MSGTKILWGQMLAALFAVLAGCWFATEWTAWRLGFQPGLGVPWFMASGLPVYRPDLFFAWCCLRNTAHLRHLYYASGRRPTAAW
jgi:type IV secretion system protein VirD4